ncbi:hypothetical protein Tco_0343260 [Tanacetum coccineum]
MRIPVEEQAFYCAASPTADSPGTVPVSDPERGCRVWHEEDHEEDPGRLWVCRYFGIPRFRRLSCQGGRLWELALFSRTRVRLIDGGLVPLTLRVVNVRVTVLTEVQEQVHTGLYAVIGISATGRESSNASSIPIGWVNEFHQDKASSTRVPVANFTLQSSVQ